MTYEIYTDSKNELYGQFFLYNNEMNEAADPVKFKIYPDNNEKIAKSFIGRHYILPERINGAWSTAHHRANDLNSLFNKQKKFSAGEIVDVQQNPKTGNFNAIVKFFPEYYDQVKRGDIPEYTSPMFAHSDSWTDGEGRLHIKDGIGVHLQGVPQPGYRPEISSIKTICEGGLDECMSELKIVAASGQLTEFQSEERFLITENQTSDSNMSMQQPQQQPPAQAPPQEGGDTEARIAALEKGFAEIQKMMQELVAKMSGAQQPPQAPAAPPVGAAGEANASATQAVVNEDTKLEPQTAESLTAELHQIKADRLVEQELLSKEREALALSERTRVATQIVENKIKLHRLSFETHDVEIQKLVDLKGADDKPADLTLLNEEILATLKQFVGAAGAYEYAGLSNQEDDLTDINHVNAMTEVGF